MASSNHALAKNGARMLMVTSVDEDHRPDNILDGAAKTFWITTGLFPQECVIDLGKVVKIKKVALWSSKIKSWSLETANTGSMESAVFDPVKDYDIEDTDGSLQVTNWTGEKDCIAQLIRLRLNQGYHDFVSIHKLVVTGDTFN